jgi:hypothetical protein
MLLGADAHLGLRLDVVVPPRLQQGRDVGPVVLRVCANHVAAFDAHCNLVIDVAELDP